MYHIYEVEIEDERVSMIAVLAPEYALAEGLPSIAVVGTVPVGSEDITSENFTANPEFANFLHYVIAKHGAGAPGLAETAEEQGDGWVYMIDLRATDPDEEIAPEDVLGAFETKDGAVVEDSYRANPKHEILTERGLLQLDEWLQERLVEEILELG